MKGRSEELIKFKPTPLSRRGKVSVNRTGAGLWSGRPVKSLVQRMTARAGRNHAGRITMRWRRGRTHRHMYRSIDFSHTTFKSATVRRLEYDPNRTAWIALVSCLETQQQSYILAAHKVEAGDVVYRNGTTNGSRNLLRNLKVGTVVSAITSMPFGRPVYVRSAGNWARVLGHEGGRTIVQLPSDFKVSLKDTCSAMVGAMSNKNHGLARDSKAGDAFHRGRRPRVRGMAMSCADHPHGGESGKTKGRIPRDKWGNLAKGGRTRRRNKVSSRFIISSRGRRMKR